MRRSFMRGMCAALVGVFLSSAKAARAEDPAPLEVSELKSLDLEQLLNINVSTASKTDVELAKTPAVMTVFSKREIDEMGLQRLEDLLNFVPGITTGRSNQLGSSTALTVRGYNTYYSENVLVLLNGQRLNDPISGGAFTMTTDYLLGNIKQVEVIRGSGSSLYGANAFAAVINLVTDPEINNEVRFGVRGGYLGSAGANTAYGFAVGSQKITDHIGVRVSAQYDYYATPNQSVPDVPKLGPLAQDNFMRMGNQRGVFDATLHLWDVQISAMYQRLQERSVTGIGLPKDGKWGPDPTITGLDSSKYDLIASSNLVNLGLRYEPRLTDHLTLHVVPTLAIYQRDADYDNLQFVQIFAPLQFVGNGVRDRPYELVQLNSRTLNADTYLTWDIADGHQVVVGLNYQRDHGRDIHLAGRTISMSGTDLLVSDVPSHSQATRETAIGGKGEADIFGGYLQYMGRVFRMLTVTGGARAGYYSQYGKTFNPRGALVFEPIEQISAKAIVETAFRGPNFIENVHSLPGIYVTNPDLKPEKMTTYQGQLGLRPIKQVSLTTSAYYYVITDAIQPTTQMDMTLIYKNAAKREGVGVESELLFTPDTWLSLRASYAQVLISRQRTAGTTTNVEGIPLSSLNYSATVRPIDPLMINLSGYSRMAWRDGADVGFGKVDLKPTHIVNANVRWANVAASPVSLSAGVYNMFDTRRVSLENRFFQPQGLRFDARRLMVGADVMF